MCFYVNEEVSDDRISTSNQDIFSLWQFFLDHALGCISDFVLEYY